MPRYQFSQGQIRVESGAYIPQREKKSGSEDVVVLIILPTASDASVKPEPTIEEDDQNASQESTQQ